jgi:hypothetical protein
MATQIQTIKAAIVTKLGTIAALNGIYSYEVAQPIER